MASKQPRFGVRVTCAGPLSGVDALHRSSVEADRLGFDTLWVHDYFVWNRLLDSVHISCGSRETFWEASARDDYQPLFLESITNLAYIAGITENIRLGLAVLCLPYREALGTAKQIANVDVLSNGRLELGVGQGAPLSTHNVEFEVMGISRGTKVRHTREVFEAMREVWTKDKATFRGEFSSFEDAEVYPKPVQKPYPPIWIGGSAEKSLEMIADYADGWLSFWITPPQFPAAIADIHRRMEARGRDPEKFTAGTEIQVYLADTTEQARAEAEPTMLAFEEGYAGTTGHHLSPEERTDTLDAIWAASLIGSPDDVSEEIGRYIESGCTAFEMKFIYHTVDHLIEQWTRFQEEVAPNFA
ncbi:LLM class flavin-dependent oxidoreductase [Candidatus Spongiisocius sp.]|uniref:LLM class flavin-dependent oxidoreductase n=1 Tax=Candidatus Spongiisocius sp. TaxID=3101273 RepID=UPI003B5A7D24